MCSSDLLSGTPLSADAGANSFIVSVTDPGSLSNTATLNLAVGAAPPMLSTLGFDAGNLVLNWSGGVGPYQVQCSTNLADTNWFNLGGLLSTNTLSITAAPAMTSSDVIDPARLPWPTRSA